VGVVSQPAADAKRYMCACLQCTQGLAGCGDGCQCGVDWGRSSNWRIAMLCGTQFSGQMTAGPIKINWITSFAKIKVLNFSVRSKLNPNG